MNQIPCDHARPSEPDPKPASCRVPRLLLWAAFSGLLALGTAGAPAWGQETAPGDEAPLTEEHTSDGVAMSDDVEEITVVGQVATAPIFEPEPIEVQVLDTEQLDLLPNLDAADAVARLPGIRTTQRIQGERAAVSIEGLPPEYTKILVDGQRYAGPVGGVADLADVPLTNVERMEILRGAQGLRHGPNAGGGVIEVQSQRAPENGPAIDVWGIAGSDEKYLLRSAAGFGRGGYGGTISFTHDEIGGYDPRDSGGVFVGVGGQDSKRRVEDLYITQELGRDGPLRGFARFGWRDQREDYVPPNSGLSIGADDEVRWLAGAGSEWWATDSLTLSAELTYYRIDVASTVARENRFVDTELRGQADLEYVFETGPVLTTATFGVDVRELTLDLVEGPVPFRILGTNPALSGDRRVAERATTGGPFLILETEPASWLTLTAGLRAQFDTRFGPDYFPQVGALVEPTSWLQIRAQYGRSGRYPSLEDLYKPDLAINGGAYFLGGNPNLEPEDTDSYRLGFVVAPDRRVSLSVTGFWNEISNLMRHVYDSEIQTGTNEIPTGGTLPFYCTPEFIDDPLVPECSTTLIIRLSPVTKSLYRLQNLDLVRTRGFESQLFLEPVEWLALRAGYTYMDTKVSFANRPQLRRLPNEPEHALSLQATLTMPSPGGAFGEPKLAVTSRYRDQALIEVSGTGFGNFTSTEFSMPSWLVDLRLTVPFTEYVEANFDVRNITDESTVDSYEVRGRSFFGGMRVRWP